MSDESFSVLLHTFRIQMGLSQNQLARLAAIDPGYVNRLEHASANSTSLPSRKVVLALADVLDLTNEGRERLLVAAGLCPEAIVRAGGWRAYQQQIRFAFEDAALMLQATLRGEGEVVDRAGDPSFVRRKEADDAST